MTKAQQDHYDALYRYMVYGIGNRAILGEFVPPSDMQISWIKHGGDRPTIYGFFGKQAFICRADVRSLNWAITQRDYDKMRGQQ